MPSTSTTLSPKTYLKSFFLGLLFFIPLLYTAWIGGSSSNIIYDANIKPNYVSINENELVQEWSYDGDKSVRFILGMVIMSISSGLIAVPWLFLILNLGARIVSFTFVTFILLTVFGGVSMFASGHELFGVVLMVLTIISGIFFFSVRKRLDFVESNLRIACASVLSLSSVIYFAVGSLMILLFWSVFWTIAIYASATNDAETSMTYNGVTYRFQTCTIYEVGYNALYNFSSSNVFPEDLSDCMDEKGCASCYCNGLFINNQACFTPQYSVWTILGFLLCFYYISLVLAHAVHTTTAAVVVKWWFFGNISAKEMAEYYGKTLSTWLGALCTGSLLVPPIRVMHSGVLVLLRLLDVDTVTGELNAGRNSASSSNCLVKLADVLFNMLSLLENSVLSYNRYAFSYLVIMEQRDLPSWDFAVASRNIADLFAKRGFTSLVHDSTLENILMMASASSGVVIMLLGKMYITLLEDNLEGNMNEMLPTCCFFIGYFNTFLALEIVLGAYSAVYVCLAENPSALQTHHPEYFEPFVSAWRKAYPEANVTFSSYSSFSFATGVDKFSVEVFPTAYMPPGASASLSKMKLESSRSPAGSSSGLVLGGSASRVAKYHRVTDRGHESDDDDVDDGPSTRGERGHREGLREGRGTAGLFSAYTKERVNTTQQKESDSAIRYDNVDDEFVL